MEAVEPIRHKSDIEKMKRLFRQKSLRDYALFTLGINTGLRISDLLALTVGDVLAGKGSRVRIADKLTLREIKTRKRRNIMLNETVRSALALYLRTRERRYPEDPLFLSSQREKDGTLRTLSRSQAYHIIVDTARAAGIASRVGTHTMRKTFGYSFRSVGENIAHHATVLKSEAAFMSSDGHKANILGSQWSRVGVGVCLDDSGYVYLVQLFVR